ncbi:MAG: hypothetical protein ALECFALPRED_008304 [Alectoria fallacina]|uniref:RNase H type-1 domain-containing protein n=1 Tax=Alectoria fallacina TaxID=1903189 RepID=A0A8H3EW71_9LECA|nr:MAG: hypothetical protein ALECFALPRED_008304 [Alectoria fallacina]
MTEVPTPALTNSLEAEAVIKQSETDLPHVPELGSVEIAKEKPRSLEEDYIPLEDNSTDSNHNRNHGPTDETKLDKAMLAKRRRLRRRRSETEAQLLRQAKIKKEMARARRAASDTQNYSTFSLYGNGNNDALVEELKISIYASNLVYPSEQDILYQGVTCFRGQITIRPHLEAMEYALDENKGRRKIPGRMTFWVDGSLSPRRVSGTAAVYRANPRAVGSEWIIRAYTVLEFDRLGTIHTEALAIMHALRIALVIAIRNDGTNAKASDVVIFSASISALHRIEDFTHEGQCWGRPLLGRIVTLANELRNVDVKVQLHWVPAHRGIPGNYLADVLAKRATRRKIPERRYLSTGRE